MWTGDHLELATNDETLFCAGTAAFLDDFVGHVRDDMSLGAAPPVRYYLLSSDELDDLAFCPEGTRCVGQRFVYTNHAVDTHELAHATRAAALGDPLPGATFFEEGLAEIYDLMPLTVGSARDVMAGLNATSSLHGRLPFEHYGVAGDFSRFVEVEHGIGSLAAFVDAQREARTVDDIAEAFEVHLGESLDAAVDRYRADYPTCSKFARTRHVVECAQPPVPFNDGHFEVSYDLSCDDPATIGPIDGRIARSFTFDVPDPGTLLYPRAPPMPAPLELPPCFGFTMEVVDCDRGCLTSADISSPNEDDDGALPNDGAWFEPGRYLVRLSRPLEDPGRVCVIVSDTP